MHVWVIHSGKLTRTVEADTEGNAVYIAKRLACEMEAETGKPATIRLPADPAPEPKMFSPWPEAIFSFSVIFGFIAFYVWLRIVHPELFSKPVSLHEVFPFLF